MNLDITLPNGIELSIEGNLDEVTSFYKAALDLYMASIQPVPSVWTQEPHVWGPFPTQIDQDLLPYNTVSSETFVFVDADQLTTTFTAVKLETPYEDASACATFCG